jgi:hypothetical protein
MSFAKNMDILFKTEENLKLQEQMDWINQEQVIKNKLMPNIFFKDFKNGALFKPEMNTVSTL